MRKRITRDAPRGERPTQNTGFDRSNNRKSYTPKSAESKNDSYTRRNEGKGFSSGGFKKSHYGDRSVNQHQEGDNKFARRPYKKYNNDFSSASNSSGYKKKYAGGSYGGNRDANTRFTKKYDNGDRSVNQQQEGDNKFARRTYKKYNNDFSSSNNSSGYKKKYVGGSYDGKRDANPRFTKKYNNDGQYSNDKKFDKRPYSNSETTNNSYQREGTENKKTESNYSPKTSFNRSNSPGYAKRSSSYKKYDGNDRNSKPKFDRTYTHNTNATNDGAKEPAIVRFNKFKKSNEAYPEKPQRKVYSKKHDNTPLPDSTLDTTKGIRLNRYISNSGICSRREADTHISHGLVMVNNTTITEMGYIVQPGDVVRYDGKVLKPEKPMYLLLNKPKNFLTTTDDPEERNTVMHLVQNACKERIYPVGRLDRNSTGLLLFTNDGEFAEKLTHPSHNVKKIYSVEIDRPLDPTDAKDILQGVMLEEGRAMVDSMAVLDETRRNIGIEIHIGWNRVIRRIFETKGYDVQRLDRVMYAGLTKKDLERGHYRFLTREEVITLKHLSN
ncbi:MAG: pseudouridine synthase [Cytophagales bacterium]|nr:pseudouridine synthase [Cytophagales bacterium]